MSAGKESDALDGSESPSSSPSSTPREESVAPDGSQTSFSSSSSSSAPADADHPTQRRLRELLRDPWAQQKVELVQELAKSSGVRDGSWPKLFGNVVVGVRATATLPYGALAAGSEVHVKVSGVVQPRQGRRPGFRASAAPTQYVVRFCVPGDGREFGRLECLSGGHSRADIGSSLGALILLRSLFVFARIVDCPPQVCFADSLLAELLVFASRSLFENAAATEGEADGALAQRDELELRIAEVVQAICGRENAEGDARAMQRSASGPHPPSLNALQRPEEQIAWLLAQNERTRMQLEEVPSPASLVSELRPYQRYAVSWMVARERVNQRQSGSSSHPFWSEHRLPDGTAYYLHNVSGRLSLHKPEGSPEVAGGILADEMGLGKTVEAIALILANPPPTPPTPPKRRRVQHASPLPASSPSTPLHGDTLIVCPMSILGQWCAELATHVQERDDFVVHSYYSSDRDMDPASLTHYQVVVTTYGTLHSTWKRYRASAPLLESGPYGLQWHRVVLDEAHIIKNASSAGARAVRDLRARHRWALTGTPLQNSVDDVFSLLQFLEVNPWGDGSVWRRHVRRPMESGVEFKVRESMSLLCSILRPIMLRRTKSTVDEGTGLPILQLPARQMHTVYVNMTGEERELYRAIYEGSRNRFNAFLAQNKLLSNMLTVLEMLMRLRQVCDHEFLLLATPSKDLQIVQDVDKFLARLSTGGDVDGSSHRQRLAAELRKCLDEATDEHRPVCPVCMESVEDAVALRGCAHVFCRDCVNTILLGCRRDRGSCPVCREPFTGADVLSVPRSSRFKIDIEQRYYDSSKVRALLTDLWEAVEARHRDPVLNGKCVVFSQWTSMLDVLEVALRRANAAAGRERIRYRRLDGSLSQRQRVAALTAFAVDDPAAVHTEVNVLLVSLKAGGVGLNLTTASNVFLVDPWWNPSVEDQAMDRIHRMGQQRVVQVRKYIVRNSVEEKMLALQAKKRSMVDTALSAREADAKADRLADMKLLFSES
ncbi:hypothetical protein CDCA_CDCA14G3850 [Cyanidium caldarium]|uniref:Uncharacterized protein n=1 Tax=Cyanidium caldarium TaxID=2771 RepID=A0AAV9J0I0_CYACA|nr:hypothetical protein CDCA_CDCA14G3850 [Cyanidium caldarium]